MVRYGGDEFVCALPDSNHLDAAARFDAVRVRLSTLCRSIPGLARSGVGFRLGLAHLEADDTLDDVIERADQDLYARRREEHADG